MDAKILSEKIDIQLSFYSPEHLRKLKAFQLPENQQPFTALPSEALEKCFSDQYRYPIVILADDQPVGFFVLYDGPGLAAYTQNSQALLLRAFSIDYKDQRKGIGKRSMTLFPAFVKEYFPSYDELVLAVNKKNESAKQLYLKTIFKDFGLKREGEMGLQSVLSCPIS